VIKYIVFQILIKIKISVKGGQSISAILIQKPEKGSQRGPVFAP